jgi:hypothetical protein
MTPRYFNHVGEYNSEDDESSKKYEKQSACEIVMIKMSVMLSVAIILVFLFGLVAFLMLLFQGNIN